MQNIRIILVNPSHPGNIGATSRAMKNMGLTRLYLVAPEAFPHPEAYYRSAGADDVLNSAVVTSDLPQALTGCEWAYAASARLRRLDLTACNVRQCAEQIVQMTRQPEVALVFGRESSGLTNWELAQCSVHVQIPTDEQFQSLNLAAAVQIFAYEIRMAWLNANPLQTEAKSRILAPHEQMLSLYHHLEATLKQVEFLNPAHPKKLMQRLQRMFNRAQLDSTEVNILRGILTSIDKMIGSQE